MYFLSARLDRPQLILYHIDLVMYQGLLILQSHIIGLCFVQSIIVSYFNFDKVVSFAIVLGHSIEDALGTVSALATIAVELILASLMLLAHTIVTAPIRDIYSFM